jgi:hypothetical protein
MPKAIRAKITPIVAAINPKETGCAKSGTDNLATSLACALFVFCVEFPAARAFSRGCFGYGEHVFIHFETSHLVAYFIEGYFGYHEPIFRLDRSHL